MWAGAAGGGSGRCSPYLPAALDAVASACHRPTNFHAHLFCLPFAVVATQEGETVKLPADAFCCAAGCQYNLNPSFLKEMGIGECAGQTVRSMALQHTCFQASQVP